MSFSNAVLARLSRFYMNQADCYDETYYLTNHVGHLDSFYGFLIRLYYRYVAAYAMASPAGLAPGSRVLDIGCGVGTLVKQFNRLGYEAHGVDVHPEALRLSVAPEQCVLADSTANLDYPDGWFDLVVSREVLEHIPPDDIDACLEEWDRVGKGRMVHLIAVTERGASATEDPTHVNVRTEQWWVDRFARLGYRAVRRPRRFFFSPFGSSGYLMLLKDRGRKGGVRARPTGSAD